MKAKIDKMSVAVEVEGKLYFVSIDKTSIALIANMIGAMQPDGVLNLVKAPDDYKFCTTGEIMGDSK